jgi:hypothetical protein
MESDFNADIFLLAAFEHYDKGEYSTALTALEIVLSNDNENINANLLFCEAGLAYYGHSYIKERLSLVKKLLTNSKEKFEQRQIKKLVEISEKYSRLKSEEEWGNM